MSVFYTGNSGRSTGPHLDFRVWDVEKGAYVNPAPFTSILSSNNSPISAYQITSPYGMRTHPTLGGQRMHHGIDYATPSGTAINVDGTFLTTWNDPGGGISSQYAFTGEDGRSYEAILMHGSDQNKVLTDSFVSDSKPRTLVSPDVPDTPDTPNDAIYNRQSAAERVAAYKSMSKGDLDKMYDQVRNEDRLKAKDVGLEMHRAYFNK